MPLLLLIDLSASGEFAAAGAEKRQVIEDAAALLALTAARRNIRVGALFFTDRVEAYVPPAGGERHAWEIVRRALGTVPQGAKTDLRLALDFAQNQAKSRAMVVLLSDLVGEGWESSLTNLAGRHDFRAVRVDLAEAKPSPTPAWSWPATSRPASSADRHRLGQGPRGHGRRGQGLASAASRPPSRGPAPPPSRSTPTKTPWTSCRELCSRRNRRSHENQPRTCPHPGRHPAGLRHDRPGARRRAVRARHGPDRSRSDAVRRRPRRAAGRSRHHAQRARPDDARGPDPGGPVADPCPRGVRRRRRARLRRGSDPRRPGRRHGPLGCASPERAKPPARESNGPRPCADRRSRDSGDSPA